jgi:hypothetical protein
MWAKSRWFQKLGGGPLEQFAASLWSRLQIPSLAARKDAAAIAVIRELNRENRSLPTAYEQYIVYSLVKAQVKREGAIAEVGVYRGSSARLICEAKGDKRLLLFDTFEGLPEPTAADRGIHRKHLYACSLAEVQSYLRKYSGVEYYQGVFPASAAGAPEQRYCFVHFDVDLYESTKACLEYFYPRMVPGGVILSHDYSLLAGVEQAFNEFFADKPEGIFDLPTTQCMVTRLD